MLLAAHGLNLLGIGGLAVSIVVGLGGVAGWVTGSVRKSIAETQRDAISDLKERVEQLEAEVKECRDRDAQKDAALKILTGQIQGSDQLKIITEKLTEAIKSGNDQYAVALTMMKANHDDVMALLTKVEEKHRGC